MIVNRSSWHYKWWKKFGGNPYHNVSLCGYVQRLFWCSLGWGMLFSLEAGALGVALYALGSAFYYHTAVTSITVGGVVVGLALLFGICYYIIEVFPNRKRKYKEPGIIGAWLQAKKDKVCPFIDFED